MTVKNAILYLILSLVVVSTQVSRANNSIQSAENRILNLFKEFQVHEPDYQVLFYTDVFGDDREYLYLLSVCITPMYKNTGYVIPNGTKCAAIVDSPKAQIYLDIASSRLQVWLLFVNRPDQECEVRKNALVVLGHTISRRSLVFDNQQSFRMALLLARLLN